MSDEIQYTVNSVYEGLNRFKDYVQTNMPYKATGMLGTVVPTNTPGVAAPVPSIYFHVDAVDDNANLLGVYLKLGPGDMNWATLATFS